MSESNEDERVSSGGEEEEVVEATVEDGGDEAEDVTFEKLGVIPQLVEVCKELGWSKPTRIQAESLPYALQGRDIIGLAETGSGKTGAFAIPILQTLLASPSPFFAVAITPTRELAFQISQQFEALGSAIGVRCAVIVGGIDMVSQAIQLAKKPHIIIGTPGRIVDHLENTKGFNLRGIKYLVLDEADRILNMDFEEEVNKILNVIPRERNTYLYSATMTSKVAKLQRASLRNPVKVEVSEKYATPKKLQQEYVFLPAKHKDCYLAYLLNEMGSRSVMIFAATCQAVQRTALLLRHLGFSAIPLHGKMTQPKRLGALNKFKAGTRSILVATDVASRGLDIPTVDLVVNYDLPQHSKDYVHRVGRTARAGRAGRAITMVTQYDVELVQRIEKLLGFKLELHPLESSSVLLLLERVNEAQRYATTELAESGMTKKGSGKRAREDDDEDDGKPAKRAKSGGGGSSSKKKFHSKKKSGKGRD